MKFILFFFCIQSICFGSVPEKIILSVKTDKKIVVDGKLNESVWGESGITTDFIQFEPNKGNTASFKTEIRVIYNDNHIYFGISCFDPEPGRIVSRVTKRGDDLSTDDSVAIALDTFYDKRTAYMFFTNILGTQGDGRLADNGRTFDGTWDGKWQSAGVKTEFGWTAEIAIDLSSIKYKPGTSMIWGLGVIRFIPRNLEIDTWSGPMESFQRVSQFGMIKGLNLKKAKKKFEIIPHIITKVQENQKTEVDVGLDARYAFSQSVSSNLTVNPDFATIESDQERINLTRFELSLNEKRNFFLEGSEIYKQRIRLFYSRRISDIYGGIKVYGKSRGYEFSLMNALSKKNSEIDEDSANFSVFRLRKDIFKSSNIGFLLANKLVNKKNYGNAGIDIVHFFSEKVNFTGQLAMSYGDQNKQNVAFFLRPSYDSSTFHIHLRYTQLGNKFADNANSVGFVTDDNRHELDSAIRKIWWMKKYGFERIEYSSNYNIYWSIKGFLRSWEIIQEIELDLANKLSFEIEYIADYKLYEKKFYNHQLGFELGYNTREWQSAILRYEFGKNFDSDYYLFGGGFNFKLTKNLSIEYDLNRLKKDPDPEGATTWIHVLRANNYFTKDLFLKFFFQTNSAIDKQNIQVVFVYRFQPPFGTIQLAYQKGTGRFGMKSDQGHTLFFKVSYVF